jgi:hypothetical protein
MQGLKYLHCPKRPNGSLVAFLKRRVLNLQAWYFQDGHWHKVKKIRGNV